MTRARLMAMMATTAVLAVPTMANANVAPVCTPEGTSLSFTGFNGNTEATWRVGTLTGTVTFEDDTVVQVPTPGMPPNSTTMGVASWPRWVQSPDGRWVTRGRVEETFTARVRCVPTPPPPPPSVEPPGVPSTPPDVLVPPVVPVPPQGPPTAPQVPSRPDRPARPRLPARPDNPCPRALLRAVWRGKAGPKWVRVARARGCVRVSGPRVCPRGARRVTFRRVVRTGPHPVIVVRRGCATVRVPAVTG